MALKKHIPNFITILNVLAGCVAIHFASNDHLIWASYMIFLAAIFDFLDGFAARLLHAYSNIGKDLDSLADVVSFGVAPSFIMFSIISSQEIQCASACISTLLPFTAFLIAIFAAVRLAIFNNDTEQSEVFKGLPVPANAIFIASLPFINIVALNIPMLLIITITLSLLMISRIELFSLKFKSASFTKNKTRYIFLVLCIVLLALLKFEALPIIIICYVMLSLILNKCCKNNL